MPCHNCNHTIQRVGASGSGGVFWCPRCGGLKFVETDGCQEAKNQTPSLVSRCQEFSSTLGPEWFRLWQKLGIEESIFLPGERKQNAGR
jgi:hypothetical protein